MTRTIGAAEPAQSAKPSVRQSQRNGLCPCGSNIAFKHCHLEGGLEEDMAFVQTLTPQAIARLELLQKTFRGGRRAAIACLRQVTTALASDVYDSSIVLSAEETAKRVDLMRRATYAAWEPEQLAQVSPPVPCDEGGWQRDVQVNKLTQIVYRSHDPSIFFPAVFIVKVRDPGHPHDGKLFDADGQHRRYAAIIAGVPLVVAVVEMTFEEARKNFELHNATATRTSLSERLAGARNPTSNFIRKTAKTNGLNPQQVYHFTAGAELGIKGKQLNLIDEDKMLSKETVALTQCLAEVWSTNPLFGFVKDNEKGKLLNPEKRRRKAAKQAAKKGTRKPVDLTDKEIAARYKRVAYCGPGMMRVLGGIAHSAKLVAIFKQRICILQKHGDYDKLYNSFMENYGTTGGHREIMLSIANDIIMNHGG